MGKLIEFIDKWGMHGVRASIARKKQRWHRRAVKMLGGEVNDAPKLLSSDDVSLYVEQILAQADAAKIKSEYFEAAQDINLTAKSVKSVAFYQSKFLPVLESNHWLGSDCTEWRNVSKARPQFLGHHQPQLPADLGFYDLRSVDVLREQAQMARRFGVDAFCFHYYWFGGKRLLETPVNNFLKAKDIDLGFCYCWANENWTRRWDGLENDILIGQDHSPEDDLAFIKAMLESFRDPRYLKIDGKPLLIVYRISLLPDAKQTAALWRRVVEEAGFPGLYLVAARSFDVKDPRDYGCDAGVEFPPHQMQALDITRKMPVMNPNYAGHIYDYPESVLRFGLQRSDTGRLFKTVMPGWDNEARKPGRGNSFHNNTPEHFRQWVRMAVDHALEHPPEERLFFINAWNEWGEGAHLEPDTRFGYAFLNTLAKVLAVSGREVSLVEAAAELNRQFSRNSLAVIFAHLFYDDLVRVMVDGYLAQLAGKADIFVSITRGVSHESVQYIKERCGNVYVHLVENRGRDVKPFMEMLHIAAGMGYEFGFKVHGKRSPHRRDGAEWRDQLISPLLGSPEIFDSNLKLLSDQRIGMLIPRGNRVDLGVPEIHAGNVKWLNYLLRGMGAADKIGKYDFHFSAGTMFAFRLAALADLWEKPCFSTENFEPESGQIDGTFAHAVERVLLHSTTLRGFTSKEI